MQPGGIVKLKISFQVRDRLGNRPIMTGDLINGPFPLDRFHGDLDLERRRVCYFYHFVFIGLPDQQIFYNLISCLVYGEYNSLYCAEILRSVTATSARMSSHFMS